MLNNLHNFSGQLLVFFERAEKIPTSLLNLLVNPPYFLGINFHFLYHFHYSVLCYSQAEIDGTSSCLYE